MEIKTILVVEDQSGPQEAFEFGLGLTLPKLAPLAEVTYVNNFEDARAAINSQSAPIDIIFLDHRLPRVHVSNLEEVDFETFTASLENIGYELIVEIRKQHPESIIVGTSSMADELRDFSEPDITLDKLTLRKPSEELR